MEIGSFIEFQLHSAELYRILSRSAQGDTDKRELEAFSKECKDTADLFSEIYKGMTSYRFEAHPDPIRESGSFRSVLRERLRRETAESKRLRIEYLRVSDNFRLKRALFNAFNDSLCRAVIISGILTA